MDVINFITDNSFLIIIIVVICFIVYQFTGKGKSDESSKPSDKKDDEGKEDSTVKRMGRGFKVMGDKIKNSDYVKGIQEENKLVQDRKMDDMMPKGIVENIGDDFYNTDLSKIGKTDL